MDSQWLVKLLAPSDIDWVGTVLVQVYVTINELSILSIVPLECMYVSSILVLSQNRKLFLTNNSGATAERAWKHENPHLLLEGALC